jgi:hypothetical protein
MSQTFFNRPIEVGNGYILMPELQFAFRANAMGPKFPLLAPSSDSGGVGFKNFSDIIQR